MIILFDLVWTIVYLLKKDYGYNKDTIDTIKITIMSMPFLWVDWCGLLVWNIGILVYGWYWSM